jgi:hypothetical protein
MKVIVAGSRHITDYQLVSQVITNTINKYDIQITELVSGCAAGVDSLGEQWAIENGIKVEPFESAWDDLTVPNALIRTNKWGKQYNARAGFQRNERMAEYGDVLIAIWDGKSNGTKDINKGV